ncbi:MAG: NADH-quinone oxidoreductase subunit J family protein [Candidatus Thorarchaeota archaeon]
MQDIQYLIDVFEQVEFFLIAGIVLVLAYLALEHKDIVYSVFFFGFMASFVAGLFLLLDAPFIAGMQIAVYTGGISALMIFGVLLLPRAQDRSLEVFENQRAHRFAMVLSAGVMAISAFMALIFPWPETVPTGAPELSQSLEGLAVWLWGTHGVYVQIIALILLAALVGAIAILKMEHAETLDSIEGEFGIEADPLDEEEPVIEVEDAVEDAPVEVDEE